MLWARKSLTAAADIPAGTKIDAAMLLAQRPGSGLPASRIAEVIGRAAVRNISAGTVIAQDMLR